MQNAIKTILAAKRKHFLLSKPVFKFFAPAAEMDLFITAQKLEKKLAVGLSQWLRSAGYGDINETLMFRNDYFACVSQGALTGCVTFARDEVGNSYAFKPEDGSIYYISLHECAYARMSDNFLAFLQELIKRDYNLAQWRESLALEKDGDA